MIGFGELGSALAEGLARSGEHRICAYTRTVPPDGAAALQRGGVLRCASMQDAVLGAGAVISAVPSKAALAVARDCASLLDPGALFVDLAAAPVADKQAAARLMEEAGGRYVDGAVLGTVAASGFEVPILACGPGARAWKSLADAQGLVVDVLEAPAGEATRLKLLRSVYMKGRDALILEMMLAARRHGLEQQVAQSIAGPGEQVPFTALADRTLRSLALHARRRAEELEASSEVVEAAGVPPRMSRAGAEVLHDLAELELRATFACARPERGEDTLAAIELRVGEEHRG